MNFFASFKLKYADPTDKDKFEHYREKLDDDLSTIYNDKFNTFQKITFYDSTIECL